LTFIVSEATLEIVLLTMKIVKTKLKYKIDNEFLAYNLIVYIKNILIVCLTQCKSWMNLIRLNHS